MNFLRLDMQRLDAGYDGVAVARRVTLQIAPGEIVALLGPNGAGKTTLLRTASGILPPLAGSVRVLGADPGRVAADRIARRGVAHVAEGRSVFSGLTVGEHLRLRTSGASLDAQQAYEYFPRLRDLADRKAGLLSGGEQQMLALACALARRPALLLVDELSLGLAPVIVERLLPVLRRYVDDTNASVLLVEQHVDLALEVSHRAVALSHGEVVLERESAALLRDRHVLESSYLGEAAGSPSGGG